MRLKKFAAIGLAALMAASTAGCGGGSGSASTEAPTTGATEATETSQAETAEEKAEPEGNVDRSKELVVYSNSTSNGQDEWLLKVAKEAGFNIQIVSIDGSALSDRLVAEKNNPVCDVVFGLNAVEYERLKKEELLVKYEPEWVGEVDMSVGDADGY